jgi:hypothetical protein
MQNELPEHVADGRTFDGVSVLIEQRFPVVLGDTLLAHHALVFAEGLANLSGAFLRSHSP